MTAVLRLDQALVTRQLVRSRGQAKELIAAGSVSVNGKVEKKSSVKVAESDQVEVLGEVDPFVSRAAHKLVAALDEFADFAQAVRGARCVDVGASTGGFTQVLLERGAQHVVALDVGHDQLAADLRTDERVTNLEGVNVRDIVDAQQLPGSPFPVLVSDLSFISLTLALPHMNFLLSRDGQAVVLVKPQFEVGRERLGRTGVVTSAQQRAEAIRNVVSCAQRHDFVVRGLAWSPKVGSNGNHEYLLWLGRPGEHDGLTAAELDARTLELTTKEAG